MSLVRVVAPYFVAGAVIGDEGRVVRAAPILAWSIGKPAGALENYCRKKGWAYAAVPALRPIYCSRRPHKAECETPNACAGGADCRLGLDPEHQRVKHQTTVCPTITIIGHTVTMVKIIPLPNASAAIGSLDAQVVDIGGVVPALHR